MSDAPPEFRSQRSPVSIDSKRVAKAVITSPEPRLKVVAASFLIQGVVIGCMFAYGVFLTVLEKDLGWSRTLLSASSSIAFLVMGLFAIVAGRLNDRYGPRWVLMFSGLATGLGYFLLSQMYEPWQLLLGFGLLAGLGLATHDVVTLSTVASWYHQRRGLMTGIVKTGTACGQLLVPMLATALIIALGWRSAFMVLAFGSAVLLVLAAQWMIKRPQTEQSAAAGESNDHGLDFQTARQSRLLWRLCVIQFCFFCSLMTVPVHIVAHGLDLGLSVQSAALVLSLIGGFSILGRLTVGGLFDRLGGRVAMMCCLVLLVGSLVLLLWIDTPSMLYGFAPFYGAAHGGLFTVVSPTVAEFFGLRAHGSIFGVILFFGALGGAAGPVMAGLVHDSQGAYLYAFVLLLMLNVVALFLSATLRPALH